VQKALRDSRQAIFDAAAAEFATRGFAGAGVDRIARRAGVNKAMIYYHFKNKDHLYREIVREMFEAIGARTGSVASSTLSPDQKVGAFVESVVAEASARRHLPPMMMREAAEGGRRLDADTLRTMRGVFMSLSAILAEGERSGSFKRVDPVLMYFTLVGPIVMYLASAPVRVAMGHLRSPAAGGPAGPAFRRHLSPPGDIRALGEHLKAAAGRTLLKDPRKQLIGRGIVRRPTSRRRRAAGSGDPT
jgi:TetR/AcrR family transcriptional regulator